MNVHGISFPLLWEDAYRSSGILRLSLSKPFSLWVNNSLKSRGATHVQGGVCKRYQDQTYAVTIKSVTNYLLLFISIGEIYMKISWISMKYQDQTYAITIKINGKNRDEQGRNQNVLLKILICEDEMHYPNPTQDRKSVV